MIVVNCNLFVRGVLLALFLLAGLSGTGSLAADAWSCDDYLVSSVVATPAGVELVDAPPFPAGGGELTIFAAASLTDPFTILADRLEEQYPDLTIELNFAGSQALVTQIIEGAQADVLATAAQEPMDRAITEGTIEGSPVVFAENRLTIVAPAGNPASIETAADLAKADVDLIMAAPEVPVGRYSRTSVCLMAAEPDLFGDNFVEQVATNVVSEENNVKSVLAKVTLGEADAGVVYVTDVTAEIADDVEIIPIPGDVNVLAAYPMAMVAGGDGALAEWYIGVVRSTESRALFESFGFETTFE